MLVIQTRIFLLSSDRPTAAESSRYDGVRWYDCDCPLRPQGYVELHRASASDCWCNGINKDVMVKHLLGPSFATINALLFTTYIVLGHRVSQQKASEGAAYFLS